MAESSSHITSSPEITPKEEHVTLDKPESPNPFLPASQVEFSFDEIYLTTNNEVALLYPSHSNSEYFEIVLDFISKFCLKESFTRAQTQYKEYLCEFWYTVKTFNDSNIWVSTPTGGIRGDIGINIFKNALRAHYLPYSSMYVSLPSITIVRPWFATINYSGEFGAKGTLKKSFLFPRVKVDYAKLIWDDIIHKLNKKIREKVVPYPRFISLLPEYMMSEYDNVELTINPTQAICNLDVHVDSKAPKPSLQTKEVPQGKKPGAKSGLRRKQSSKHTSESKTEASKSKTGQSEKETQSSSAKDKSPSHPSPPTPVVGEMHKEAQQAASGPTSLGDTSKEGAHPQLNSADSTAEADPRNSDPNDSIPSQQDQTKSVEDGLKTAHTDSDESEKEVEVDKDKDIHATSHDVPEDTSIPHTPSPKSAQIQELKDQVRPSYPDINQLTDVLVTSLKPKFSKILASHDFAICLPNALKELPSKFTELSREIKELNKHVQDMEIKLPGDLKEIPTKLETFTSTISSLSSQVAELENIQ
ncbi:hypothetical protein Tco_0700473 [Tanacetum coccineum]